MLKILRRIYRWNLKEYTYVKTLVDRGNVKEGEIGYIIDIFDKPCEG